MPSMNKRSASSRKHCDSPKVWVRRANPSLRPQSYCRTPANPDAAKKSDCLTQGGSWVLRKKAALKRRQGYCKGANGAAEPSGDDVRDDGMDGMGGMNGMGGMDGMGYDGMGGDGSKSLYRGLDDEDLLGRKKSKRSKKMASMSHGKIKFYPKGKKSCKKRHMNWNVKTKRCNKSK